MKFRKRPIVIEARQFTVQDAEEVAKWCGGQIVYPTPPGLSTSCAAPSCDFMHPHVLIETLEGRMEGETDDWIICGIKGEFYPCKPDIFQATYEPWSN